ncbi:uncharacterized protein RSE6_01605 [Rhynchosporium secalis]|uniref:Uncharacterized protein n=1 Tax=Rhynchosporium secalis TaxID=38038 RepID=A0A1E1LY73_RHYSE|nr:uncharacterized protein RSE6_01605 [Rhynchosporium secalis]
MAPANGSFDDRQEHPTARDGFQTEWGKGGYKDATLRLSKVSGLVLLVRYEISETRGTSSKVTPSIPPFEISKSNSSCLLGPDYMSLQYIVVDYIQCESIKLGIFT